MCLADSRPRVTSSLVMKGPSLTGAPVRCRLSGRGQRVRGASWLPSGASASNIGGPAHVAVVDQSRGPRMCRGLGPPLGFSATQGARRRRAERNPSNVISFVRAEGRHRCLPS